MAISVDRVYQTVLAVANKEQRGYITPQEFNLFANHAQNTIFEQYFYDLNQFLRIPSNKTVSSDPRDIVEEKIALFREANASYGDGDNTPLGAGIYRLEGARFELEENGTSNLYEAEEVTKKEYDAYHRAALTMPPVNRPIFYRANNTIVRSPQNTYSTVFIDYIRRPIPPKWTYAVIQGKAIYNPNADDWQDFELHESEEKNLVVKILQLAGVAIKDYNLTQLASQEDAKNIQLEKS